MRVAKDFLNEILDRLGWPQIDSIENPTLTSRHRKLLAVTNRALKVMGTYSDWAMLRKAGTLILVASETSDTTAGSEQYVTATQNSDTITVDNIVFNDTYIGRALQIGGSPYVFDIISVPAPGQLQLHRAWVEDSIVPADEITFTIAADRYALPDDYDRFSDKAVNAFIPLTVSPVDPPEFAAARRNQSGIVLDDPNLFTVWGLNPGETNQLAHFNPYPRDARMVNFDYQRLHPEITSNNDKILYPESAVHILIDAILEIANGDLEADDAKVARVLDRMMRNYNMQQSHLGPTANKTVLRPDNGVRSSFRNASPRIKFDWGEFWDRAEDILPQ